VRALLIAAAAQGWGTALGSLTSRDGAVLHVEGGAPRTANWQLAPRSCPCSSP
jgi:hypothetical protein